jgi:hypothetical protein
MAMIKRIDMSRGLKSNTLKGAVYGALAGGLVFGTIGGTLIEDDSGFQNLAVFIWGVSGLVTGAGIGVLIGRSWHTERWDQVPLPVSLAVAPTGGGDKAFGLALKFTVPIGW